MNVSVPLKLSKCAAPPIAADSWDVDPRYPKSCHLKSMDSGVPVFSRKPSIILRLAYCCDATVMGYQTCISRVSAKLVSQGSAGSVFSTVNKTCDGPSTVPSGTA